jgi:hypothetical protein
MTIFPVHLFSARFLISDGEIEFEDPVKGYDY